MARPWPLVAQDQQELYLTKAEPSVATHTINTQSSDLSGFQALKKKYKMFIPASSVYLRKCSQPLKIIQSNFG